MADDHTDPVLVRLRSELSRHFDLVVDNLIQQTLHAAQSDRVSWVENHALLDDDACATLLGVTLGKLADLRQEDDLPFLVIGRYRRYERAALLAWIEANLLRGPVRQ